MQFSNVFIIKQLPDMLNENLFINSFLGKPFALHHDFKNSKTYIILDKKFSSKELFLSISGLSLFETDLPEETSNLLQIFPYYEINLDNKGKPLSKFDDFYKLFYGKNSSATFIFYPSEPKETLLLKKEIEIALSKEEIRANKQSSFNGIKFQNESKQYDLFYDYGKRNILLSMLTTVNECLLNNGFSYSISILVKNTDKDIISYLNSKVYLLATKLITASIYDVNFELLNNKNALPFSEQKLSSSIFFSDHISTVKSISTEFFEFYGEIPVGTYLKEALNDTNKKILLDRNVFNLGTLVTGVPGSGKTSSTMHIIKELLSKNRPYIGIISPTEEWNYFGAEFNLFIIKLYNSKISIPFFNCPKTIKKEKFYENLAMLLSSASNSGPYKNAMEKCLLSAFSKVYEKTISPEPEEVYEEIINKVIERHGKRTNTGVKLSKHGENIIAALEPIRLMLKKEEFAYSKGANFIELLKKGVVFDLSEVSNSLKPFFYSLILNQIYSVVEDFDTFGDKDLRMLLCLEEAQLIFKDENSVASFDIMQRIQDFRKKGIGLFLITHNVNDIALEIRRLCQLKLYFRQSPDSAKIAFNDLILSPILFDDVVEKLKLLKNGTCIFTPIIISNERRDISKSIFINTLKHFPQKTTNENYSRSQKNYVTQIKLLNSELLPIPNKLVDILYLEEVVDTSITNEFGVITTDKLIKDKLCKIIIHGNKKKDSLYFKIKGGIENKIVINNYKDNNF